LFEYYCVKAV